MTIVDPSAQTVTPPQEDFFQRWVVDNPWLGDRQELLARWLNDPTPREDIAKSLGLPLGALLRSFNDTAPLSEPWGFRYRAVRYSVVGMRGVCDDIVGERFPPFGTPVTLRCFLAEEDLLPQEMFDIADWNYMDAGRPGFVGYAYGVEYEGTLYLAGLQSDIATRYGYLFQARGAGTEVRTGDEVAFRDTADLAIRFGAYVPVLRRTFQRYWIQILLGAVLTWAQAESEISELGLLRFTMEPEEQVPGHVVHRVYRLLPERLGCITRRVQLGEQHHLYNVTPLTVVAASLGTQWKSMFLPHNPNVVR